MKARDNPFSTDRVLRIRYRPQGTTWEALLSRLAMLQYRAAVVGPHGSGKTTFLEDCQEPLRILGFSPHLVRLDESSGRPEKRELRHLAHSLGPRDFLLLDGAEQLNSLSWSWVRWLSRRAGGVLISLHSPSRYPTLLTCRASLELFETLVAELHHEPTNKLREVFAKHRGNVRESFRELYDLAS